MNSKMAWLLACAVSSQAAYEWNSVQIQGGGYVPGVTFHPTEPDLAYIRTDVGGAYRLEASTKKVWIPLNDMFSDGNDMGSVAIAVDPDNADYVYSTGGLYTALSWCNGASFLRSSDRGVTWEKIPLNNTTVSGVASSQVNGSSALCLAGNGEGRGMGNRLAAKGSTLYLGTNQNGLLKSTDRGSTWSTVSFFDKTSGVGAVMIDKNGQIFAAPYAGGVYKSSNGEDWTKIGTFSGIVYQMSYSPADNSIWLTSNSGKPYDQSESSGGSVYKINVSASSISQVTMPSKGNKDYGYTGVSVNPKNAKQVLVSTGGWWKGKGGPIDPTSFVPHDGVFMSTDGGATWKDILMNGIFDTKDAYNAATSNPHWVSALAVNPNDEDHVIFGTGYGVWSTFDATASKPTWYFTDKGIEETVPLGLASTPFGAPLVSVLGDVDGFYHSDLNTPPMSRHKVEDGKNEAGTNYDLDWAGQNPSYMVRIYKNSDYGLGGYSTDGGKTWKNFKTHPNFTVNQYNPSYSNEDNFVGVSADGTAIVWNMATYGVFYSTDNGATWTASKTAASQLQGFRVVADRVQAGTFYLYNAQTGTLYKSTNNGADWVSVNTTLAQFADWGYHYGRLFASPDAAGELWVTQGANIAGGLWVGKGNVYRSTNGGTSFAKVPDLLYASSIGFGKGKSTHSAVYALGINSQNENGLFRSDDQGETWDRINDDRHQFGGIKFLIGDPCVYSRIYLGTNGRGIVYGHETGNKNTCSERVDFNSSTTALRAPTQAHSFLKRQGNQLWSNTQIDLYNIQGKPVRSAHQSLSLDGLPQGLYIAKSGAQVIKVQK